MTRRIRIGPRDGIPGIYVSKPGYDALTADPANMILMMSGKYSNLLKLGVVPSTAAVALGYGAKPFVTITSISDLSAMPDIVLPANARGPIRPAPAWTTRLGDQSASAAVASDGSTMTITSPVGVWYAVYSRIFS